VGCDPCASQDWKVLSQGCPGFPPLICLKRTSAGCAQPGKNTIQPPHLKTRNLRRSGTCSPASSYKFLQHLSEPLFRFSLWSSHELLHSVQPLLLWESVMFRELAQGCGVRVKHCKDVFATSGWCPSAALCCWSALCCWGLEPGDDRNAGYSTCISVLDQPLKHTGQALLSDF